MKAVKDAVPIPVTAKIRKGFRRGDDVAVEVARACEAGGADAITVHGRTRDQMYAPPNDRECIARVKAAVKVPVIANGDIVTAADAASMYEETGCDLVMIGRGALGAPWIFTEIHALLHEGRTLPAPPLSRRMAVLYRQTELAAKLKGEKVALLEARKHAAWYIKGIHGAAAYRQQVGMLESVEQLEELAFNIVRENM